MLDASHKVDIPFAEGTDHLPVEKMPVRSLLVTGSPRSLGHDQRHAEALAQSGDRLPPILVHRHTMRIIDGAHRLEAAKLRGEDQIEVRFVEGDEGACFVLAVTANVRHGMPLTLSDKKDAAAHIIALYPQWSDRKIATATALHHQTVATIRRRSAGENSQLNARVGRDGRCRPADGAQRRELASQLIASNPGASLREIARKAQISPATASRVRARLKRGDTTTQAPASTGNGQVPRSEPPRRPPVRPVTRARDRALGAWHSLRANPALRSTQHGRALVQTLGASSAIGERSEELIEAVPAYSLGALEEAAMECAQIWQDVAVRAQQRSRGLRI
jgi:ParB-like chromosome segregation protein Spo0J